MPHVNDVSSNPYENDNRPFEPIDHFTPFIPQQIPDDHRVRSLEQLLRMLAENCSCLDGNACKSGNHERYQVLMRELKSEDTSTGLFSDVASCADLNVASVHAGNGMKDSVRLGLDALCTEGGVKGQVIDKHPHDVLSMLKTIAEVPRKTSTAMSARSDPEVCTVLLTFIVYAMWRAVVEKRVCKSCTQLLPDFWWHWAQRRGADDRWKPEATKAIYDGEMPCGFAHGWASTAMARTGGLADGIFGDYCSHVGFAIRSGLVGNTMSNYISIVLHQAATQLAGQEGDHVSGWGAARVVATVAPVWDELFAALAADGESTVGIAAGAIYALGSDYANDISCSVQPDGTMRFIMYDRSNVTPVVLYDITVKMEYYKDDGQPEWSMAILRMWRDQMLRQWNPDKDMCFDKYVRAYLKKDSDDINTFTCNTTGISWQDVRDWHHKNQGRRAGTLKTLTGRKI
ncbi:hypothetical protein BGW42_001956 [Actinomortierella wolfii]|nr:hypothetical protein BGW42_001956 [Actinomortierella wolfii]